MQNLDLDSSTNSFFFFFFFRWWRDRPIHRLSSDFITGSLIVTGKFGKHSLWQEVPSKLILHVFRGGKYEANFYSRSSHDDSSFPPYPAKNVKIQKKAYRVLCNTLVHNYIIKLWKERIWVTTKKSRQILLFAPTRRE